MNSEVNCLGLESEGARRDQGGSGGDMVRHSAHKAGLQNARDTRAQQKISLFESILLFHCLMCLLASNIWEMISWVLSARAAAQDTVSERSAVIS